jgi:hypothetical protein
MAAAFVFSLNGFLNVVLFAFTRPGLFLGRIIELAPVTQSKVTSQTHANDRHTPSDFEPSYVDISRDIKLAPRDALTNGLTSIQSPNDKGGPVLHLESAYDIGVAIGFTMEETEQENGRVPSGRGYGSDCSSDYWDGPRGFV